MAEAEEEPTTTTAEGEDAGAAGSEAGAPAADAATDGAADGAAAEAAAESDGAGSGDLAKDTGAWKQVSVEEAGGEGGAAEGGADGAAPAADAPAGPGFVGKALTWLRKWHPLVFLGVAAGLAAYAYSVYPEPESRKVPPAELFYYDGLDRLYRVLNPDLPLIAATPADDALAARTAFLNLFVFHRENMRNYPTFINPHLLLAEANRILAEFNPASSGRYYADALAAYNDALLWESRVDTPENLAVYAVHNFLDGQQPPDSDDAADPAGGGENEEITLRRARRNEYILYRKAEADVNSSHPELARVPLEDIQRAVDGRQREELRRNALAGPRGDDLPRREFELGPDEYRLLDLLLAKAYDGLGRLDAAKLRYLRYLDAVPAGRNHAFVVERLARLALDDGELYRRVDPDQARGRYQAAIDYYRQLQASPSATREQNDQSVLGLALANSRLAGLVPAGAATGIDDLSALGRTVKGWLEEFSGQPLPRRTLGLPAAVGQALASPELFTPGSAALPGVVGGSLAAMAGGLMPTPHEWKRVYLGEALENYDRVAALRRGTEAGDRAAVAAAREAWNLGLKEDTEARLERMIEPLSSPDLILAARLGLAAVALDRGDLRRAHMLLLGGRSHPMPLWFTPDDADWRALAVRLGTPDLRRDPGVWRRVWEALPDEGREIAAYAASGRRLDDDYVGRFLRAMNTMLRLPDLYTPADFPPSNRNANLQYLLDRDPELLTPEDVAWRNRLLLEEALPYDLAQRGAKDNVAFDPFPAAGDLLPAGLVESESVRDLLTRLAEAWSRGATPNIPLPERLRLLKEGNSAYQAALDSYRGEPGEILYALARNYENMAEIREVQGDHMAALALTRTAALSYMDVSLRAPGSPREMDSLLAAGDAFFRSGLLERASESQKLFLDRFGYSSLPGTESAISVVRAENLLGRAYWFLGDTPSALESFRRNVARRTPDRYKSIYYIGRVLMEEGLAKNQPELLGADAPPLPALDRNNNPVIETALQAFNYLRQSPDINPEARAWRWTTFDLARLRHTLADSARRAWEAERAAAAAAGTPDEDAQKSRPWLALYDTARVGLTEALERYPLRRNGNGNGDGTGNAGVGLGADGNIGVSVRVEPEDYADTMAARFEAEYLLANTLLTLADGRQDDELSALARAHLANLSDRDRYAAALFDTGLDRFQLNSAVIREEVDGGNWDRSQPLPRTRLGDDEGPTRDPARLRETLRNSMLLLANEYFRTGEKARERTLLASAAPGGGGAGPTDSAPGYYQQSYRAWQDIYDRFGLEYGSQAMVSMGDNLNRLGYPEDAKNHYRMARNMADLQAPETMSDGVLNIGPAFWGDIADARLRDMDGGYNVP